MKQHIIILLFIVFSGHQLLSQTYSNEFLAIGIGARAHGMSGAVTATTNDLYSSYWNPAGLAQLDAPFQIGVMHAEWFGGVAKYDFLGFAKPLSNTTKMLVVSDGDIARNEYDVKQGAMLPLGYNRFENYKFANKDFLLNAIEYMLDDKGIIEARGKEVRLRLLDAEAVKSNTTLIRIINIALPLVLVSLFGAFFLWRRKKRFAEA